MSQCLDSICGDIKGTWKQEAEEIECTCGIVRRIR